MDDNKTTHIKHTPGYGIYILVWLALVTLTALTATVAGISFGKFSIAVALVIAMIKSYLVLSEFMHLKFEMKAFRIFVLVAILFFLLLIVLLFQNYSYY
ncbi:MAG TPA: cytochrome C oxidase subunit IV family protein [Ignavibacteriaceae bacterium]|nr:cytochrome C oxidase subunit IV family protein [Ignavibacteriaceae bacterium]